MPEGCMEVKSLAARSTKTLGPYIVPSASRSLHTQATSIRRTITCVYAVASSVVTGSCSMMEVVLIESHPTMRDLFGDKVARAIELMRMYQPNDRPYYGCFSGGKDSCVIKEIARIGNINVGWHYNVTTIDPPELVRFIKHNHPDVMFEMPRRSFFESAKINGFPTRMHRWCCREFKERQAPNGSVMIFGVRAAESARRAKIWKEISAHIHKGQYAVSPILNWGDSEVWSFLKERSVPYCSLYDDGFKRLGCIGCPQAGADRGRQFVRWPHMERAWKRLFEYLYTKNARPQFNSALAMFDWWLSDNAYPKEHDCQGILDMYS